MAYADFNNNNMHSHMNDRSEHNRQNSSQDVEDFEIQGNVLKMKKPKSVPGAGLPEPGPKPDKPLIEWTKEDLAQFCPNRTLAMAIRKFSSMRGEDLIDLTEESFKAKCPKFPGKKAVAQLVALVQQVKESERPRHRTPPPRPPSRSDSKEADPNSDPFAALIPEVYPEARVNVPSPSPPHIPVIPPAGPDPVPQQPQHVPRGAGEAPIAYLDDPFEEKKEDEEIVFRPPTPPPPPEPNGRFPPLAPGQNPRDVFNSIDMPLLQQEYEDYGNDLPDGHHAYLPDLEVRYPQHPSTNGPNYRARMKGTDPADEPLQEPNDNFDEDAARRRYGGNLSVLSIDGWNDEKRNLRLLKYYSGSVERIRQYYSQTCHDIRIGDRVIRDVDWIWGDQDSCHIPLDPHRNPNEIAGRDNHFGVVRGLRRWHPNSAPASEVIVQWDNNYVGNYRFGHEGAYDVRVTARGRQIHVRPLHVGDTVVRGADWKHDDEDGGNGERGEVLELYSAPTTFAPGVRVAVMWDKDVEHWLRKAAEHRDEVKRKRDDPGFSEEENTRRERLKFPEGRWVEPDVLCRPPVRYRWGVDDQYDLWPVESGPGVANLEENEFLQVTDQVTRGRDHRLRPGEPADWGESTVMAVDQWDPLSFPVRGDRVTVLHNPKVKYKFNYNDTFECRFSSRGEDFQGNMACLKVGDKVTRGFDWMSDYYENEDGGEGSQGTVTSINYVCSITSVLAKVRWENGNENLYGWGWKDKYELRRLARRVL